MNEPSKLTSPDEKTVPPVPHLPLHLPRRSAPPGGTARAVNTVQFSKYMEGNGKPPGCKVNCDDSTKGIKKGKSITLIICSSKLYWRRFGTNFSSFVRVFLWTDVVAI